MFGDLGWGEVLVLIVLALFIFGPERLPKLASDLGRGLRQMRRMAMNAKDELQDNLGPEYRDLDITDLHPRTFVRKHLLEDDEYEVKETSSYRRASTLDNGERPPFDDEAT